MEIYSTLTKKELTKNICQIFNLKKRNITWEKRQNKKELSCHFYYKNIKIIICFFKERYLDIYTFWITYIDERLNDELNDVDCESTPFWYVYSYYENKKYNPLINDELLSYYLNQSKVYIDSNKLIFYQTDIRNKRCFLYIDGIKKEVSFGIDADIKEQCKKDFGDKWQNIYNNRPDY